MPLLTLMPPWLDSLDARLPSFAVTPLMYAAIKGHMRVAETLQRHGARSVSRTGEHVTRVKKLEHTTGEGGTQVYGLQRARRRHATESSGRSGCDSSMERSSRPADEADADTVAHQLISEEAETRSQKSSCSSASSLHFGSNTSHSVSFASLDSAGGATHEGQPRGMRPHRSKNKKGRAHTR